MVSVKPGFKAHLPRASWGGLPRSAKGLEAQSEAGHPHSTPPVRILPFWFEAHQAVLGTQ